MSTLEKASELLGGYLNRNASSGLVGSLLRFYKKDNSLDGLQRYFNALGLVDVDKINHIRQFVRDNTASLESEIGLLLPTEAADKLPPMVRAKKEPKEPKARPIVSLSYDMDSDAVEEEGLVSREHGDARGNGNEHELGPAISQKEAAPRPTFKKIKKQDALRLKEETGAGSLPSSHQKRAVGPKPKPKAAEKGPSALSKLADEERIELDYNVLADCGPLLADVEVEEGMPLGDFNGDREWYLTEETQVRDSVVEEPSSAQEEETMKRRRKSMILSGGKFDDVTGEDLGFDHESDGEDLSQIPVVSHLFIPPFLKDREDDIVFQLRSGTGLHKMGPSFSPIKDPNSELAMSAKNGSFVLQERKKIHQREQAKEFVSMNGTAIGSALKVDTGEVKAPKEHREPPLSAYSAAEILEQRRSLPAYSVRDEFVRTIAENQVTIVIGETGSGKTTQLAQFLFEENFTKSIASDGIRKMIGCTQPRRVAAMSVAHRVAQEMNCKLGKEVGYSIRFEDKTDPNTTAIKFLTEGLLLREFLVDSNLSNYSCIIMDEAHERSINTDILLGLFKQLLRKRRDLKLIVTSATMNADRFSRFFGNSPQFTIPGRTFPVDVMFSKSSNCDYVETAVKQVVKLHLLTPDGDILVFMTGQEDIEVTCKLIKEKLDILDDPPPIEILPIYSMLPSELQGKIFQTSSSGVRKVVVATNIAETSLTIDGIKYVVDTGLVKLKVYNPKLGMDTLQVIPISVANAQQRSGRAGRTGPGVAYRLYTERAITSNEMFLQPIPEIQRTNLSNTMLLLKSLKVNDVSSFAFLDRPPSDLLSCGLFDLWSIGALDNLGELTELGTRLVRFPMELTLGKLIVLSCKEEFHCSQEAAILVAMLSAPNVFIHPKEFAKQANLAREKFLVLDSDHLTLINVFRQWESKWKSLGKSYKKLNAWCEKNFLHPKSLLRANDIRNQVLLIMKNSKYPLLSAASDEDVRKCICASFYQQLAKLVKFNVMGSSEYVNLRHNYMKAFLHPTSALNEAGISSQFVVYHEFILTTRQYINYVTAVDPRWLLEYGFYFYNVPEHYVQKHGDYLDSKYREFKEKLEQDRQLYATLQHSQKAARGQESLLGQPLTKFRKRRAF